MSDRYIGLIPEAQISELVNRWLHEDCPSFDIAGAVIYGKQATAQILCKADGVLCGKPFVQKVFETLNCQINWLCSEGDYISVEGKSIVVADISGEARNLLLGERVALNILTRASGIATRVKRIAEQLESNGFKGKLAGTRKTTPGFRLVEKYAMIVGGCDPHRYDLSSMIMLKDNHIDITGSIKNAVEAAKKLKSFSQKIEVECSDYDQAIEALESGADVIMLDNAGPVMAKTWSHDIKKVHPNAIIEVSGGVTEVSIVEYMGEPGQIDIISMGSLTQDIIHIDFSMRINKA